MGVAIRRATEGDRADLVRLLDEAFMDDPVSGWVFPELLHTGAAGTPVSWRPSSTSR